MTKNQKIIKHLNEENKELKRKLHESNVVAIHILFNYCAYIAKIDNKDINNLIAFFLYQDETLGVHSKPWEQFTEEEQETVTDFIKKMNTITGEIRLPPVASFVEFFEDMELPEMIN